MTHTNPPVFSSLRIIVLALGLASMPVFADDYGDVTQLVRSNKLSEALNRADQFLATQPKDPQMRFIKGVILRDSGKTADAIAIFTKLTEDYPELPEPYNNLAVMYASQSQFEKARAALEMAIRTNPSYSTAHENLGDIYAKLASQAYNKALQLDNTNQAVPPKLALIREVFSTNIAKPQRQASSPGSSATPVATSTVPTPPVAVAKPPVSIPPPVAIATITPPKVAASTPPVAQTPPAVAPVKPVTPPTVDSDTSPQAKDVEAAVAKWASVWSARDVKAYLASYGKDFDPPGNMSRKTWEEERQQRISGKASISVKIDKLSVSVNGNHAVAKFRQDYKAGGLAVSSHKTLDFAKVGDHWQIVKETVGN
jgi:tetratricopeptide (TPR) repeat protein